MWSTQDLRAFFSLNSIILFQSRLDIIPSLFLARIRVLVSRTFESSRVKENKSLIAEREIKMRFQAIVVSRSRYGTLCDSSEILFLWVWWILTMWRKFKIRRLYRVFLVIILSRLFELWRYLNDTMNFEIRDVLFSVFFSYNVVLWCNVIF